MDRRKILDMVGHEVFQRNYQQDWRPRRSLVILGYVHYATDRLQLSKIMLRDKVLQNTPAAVWKICGISMEAFKYSEAPALSIFNCM
jgi:hypothetical protein